ncbi:Ceramide glucosyltransferase [Podosphaera aphanis]|nr:Ceramide glucosyltransferase [Podosphaera aphanis]
MLSLAPALALACGIWYIFVVVVQLIGFLQLYRHYSTKPKAAVSASLSSDQVPHVTVLRPVKGLEPQLYECLAATFKQSYPRDRLTTYFCVASAADAALPTLRRLLTNFSDSDAKIFINEHDQSDQQDGQRPKLGPNPKIQNMSRAYKEAKGDVIWILDSNIWVGRGVAARMVDKLCGFSAHSNDKKRIPYKLVHQLPVVIDGVGACWENKARTPRDLGDNISSLTNLNRTEQKECEVSRNDTESQITLKNFGGRLEEMFISSSHAKFYTAINTVSVAPCVVGKSNMFRKSHLAYLTAQKNPHSPGIDFFSENICEDHLIGDLLWREKVLEEQHGHPFYRHGIMLGDLAIQPMAGMSIQEYAGRRVRWLRVRKWTVPLATLVEPGVEPFVCSAFGAFSLTHLPWLQQLPGISFSWPTFALAWLLSISIWMWLDAYVYTKLHSGTSIEFDAATPSFLQPPKRTLRHPTRQWVLAWLTRELLALPIWLWACFGGTVVTWRGKQFCVNYDMTVSEVTPPRVRAASKARQD